MSGRAGTIALAGAAILVTLLALEVGLRLADAVTSHDLLHLPRSAANTSAGTTLRLIDLIRPSADPDLVYELAPGVRGQFMGAPVRINDDGYRGRPISPGRPAAGVVRLVALGDSIAFGWGVDEDETFLRRIEVRFRADHPDGPVLEGVNLGVPGYNTHQEVEALVARGLDFSPSIVVLVLCGNDTSLPNFVARRRSVWTLRRSHLRDFVSSRLKQLVRGRAYRNREPPKGLDWGFASRTPERLAPALRSMVGLGAVHRALKRLAKVARRRRMAVVYTAYAVGGRLDDRVRPLAAKLGFDLVDLRPHVDAARKRLGGRVDALTISLRDRHPNPEHHRLIGDAIYEEAIRPWFEAIRSPAPGVNLAVRGPAGGVAPPRAGR